MTALHTEHPQAGKPEFDGLPVKRYGIEFIYDLATQSESDPHGKSQHETGAKLDAGKILPWLMIEYPSLPTPVSINNS